jgi:chromosome segregation ATPase
MFENLPNELIFAFAGAFVLGWILASIAARLRSNSAARKQDPRDARIRELEAEVRIAQSDNVDSRAGLDKLEDALTETTVGLERRDHVITKQQSELEKVAADLKDSVIKTRELRTELVDRAAQGMHAEAKIREVETELSVAQASTDMIATGVLDYSLTPSGKIPAELVLEEDDEPNDINKTSS